MTHWRVVIILVAFSAIVMLPPVLHGYIYPTIGDDAAVHLDTFQRLDQYGYGHTDINYFGQIIVGYPLIWLPFDITVSWLWFNYVALLFAALSFFYITTRLVDVRAGLVALVLPAFAFGGILFQWYSGTIFNIINMTIMLWCVYHALRVMEKLSIARGFTLVLLAVLAYYFHHSGVYLIVMLPATVLAHLFLNRMEHKYLAVLVVSAAGLFIVSLTSLSPYPFRQHLDSMTMGGLAVSAAAGIILGEKKPVYSWIVAGLVVMVSISPVYHWLADYNSAVKPADVEAMNYVRALPGDYFSCSPDVAPWIYQQYTGKTYQVGQMPFISRGNPMTQRTLPESEWYWAASVNATLPPYTNADLFTDKQEYVSVYY